MKKRIIRSFILMLIVMFLEGCYASQHMVGTGGTYEGRDMKMYDVKKKKWYLLYGAVQLDNVNARSLAGGVENYTSRETFSFGDLVIGGLTFGIVVPRTIRISISEGEK